MISYICSCGFVGFLDEVTEVPGNKECGVHCARCGSPEKHFHGWGEVQMSTEEKIQGFVDWVGLERSKGG